jgi:hypothetical protein
MALVVNIGRLKQGKTTLAVHRASQKAHRVMIDPRGLVRRPGAIVAYSADGFRRGMQALTEGDADEVVFTPRPAANLDDAQLLTFHSDAFGAFSRAVMQWTTDHPRRELAVLVDEAKFYGDITKSPSFMYVIKSCDLDRVDVIVTCHRPKDIKPDLRFHIDKWNLFRTTQEDDLDVIRERATAAVVDQVQQLGDHELVIWNDGDGTSRVHRASWTWFSELSPRGAAAHILELP